MAWDVRTCDNLPIAQHVPCPQYTFLVEPAIQGIGFGFLRNKATQLDLMDLVTLDSLGTWRVTNLLPLGKLLINSKLIIENIG